MINDKYTNLLYLADCLPKKHPTFYKRFEELLKDNQIKFSLLSGTKDIWCRDYMPIQNSNGDLVKFEYNPDYLSTPKEQLTITDSSQICKKLGLPLNYSYFKLDGGNIIHYGSKVIMCDKVLDDNFLYSKEELIDRLRRIFRVNQIIFIPTHPKDPFGHADGIVRFVKSNLVLINKYQKEDADYKLKLINVLKKVKLNFIEIPYNPYDNKNELDATGIYLNYLQVKEIVFVPVYGLKEDDKALEVLRSAFIKKKIVPVRSNEIARTGGVLNCISWTIKRTGLNPQFLL